MFNLIIQLNLIALDKLNRLQLKNFWIIFYFYWINLFFNTGLDECILKYWNKNFNKVS